MDEQSLYLLLKQRREISCKNCQNNLLDVNLIAKSLHTLSILDKEEAIEIRCPVCKTQNVFTKAECINKKVFCLKCNRILDTTYPGLPSNITALGKETVFYKLKIICPNPICSKENEFYI